MRYLRDDVWARLSLGDFRARFFIETYIEKLSMYTPHFYQSRLMSVLSSCAEVVTYIDEYKVSDKNRGYILSGMDEFDAALGHDPISQALLEPINEPRKDLFKSVRGGDFSPGKLNRLRVVCVAILACEADYFDVLLSELTKSVIGAADLTQKDRITSRIETLTGLYTTHLLNMGYSPTYLYNRAEQFTRPNNYSGRSFEVQFKFVTERLRSHKIMFDVYFALYSNRPSTILDIKDDQDFVFYDKPPAVLQARYVEKLKKDFDVNVNVVARCTIQSTDHVSAAWRVKEKLDKLLDAVTALQLNPRIRVSPHCVVVSHLVPAATESLNIDLLIGFLTSESGTYFAGLETSIRGALRNLDEESKERLSRSLRYLRLARDSVSLEQKLLNLWISLESIFSSGEGSALIGMEDYVPQIYAVSSLRRRIRYLRDLLGRNEIPTTPAIRGTIDSSLLRFSVTTTESLIFKLVRNEALAIELFNSLGPLEHLKFGLLRVFRELGTNEAIVERLQRSQSDVMRQLRRIYFLRNKMAHSGHYGNVRAQLVTHLLDYIANCYMAITESAKHVRPGNTHSINDFLAAYKLGADAVVTKCMSKDGIDSIDQLIPVPII